MRYGAHGGSRDPLGRVLIETANALKTRQRLPGRDPRRAGAMWVRPSWPGPLLLGVHRKRLAKALAQDETLRREVRGLLHLADPPALDGSEGQGGEMGRPSSADAPDRLAAAIATVSDPFAVVQAAAVDSDPAVAAAASPYLSGELPMPAAPSPHALKATGPGPKPADPELRRQIRELKAQVKSVRRKVQDAEEERDRLRRDLSLAVNKAERAEASAQALREQLPSRREREALADASTQQDKIADLRRKLDIERAARRADCSELRERLSEAGQALARTQEKLDRERRGRHRLEADLGNADGRACRLAPLVEREAAALQQAIAEMREGPDKTRRQRRANSLRQLTTLLQQLYDLGPSPSNSVTSADENHDAHRGPVVQVRPRGLTVTPLGGAHHIGGSALLLQAGSTRLLIDAGLKPQAHISHPGPDRIDEAIRERIDAVIVTHAHADHAGFVPWVIERQRQAAVLCSPETKALLPTVWADSVRVMRTDADAVSTHGEHCEPPYGDAEVAQAEDALRGLNYGNAFGVGDVEVTLFRAGHILGAAGVVVRAGERRVVVTGDIDDRGQASVGPAMIPPKLAAGADLLVIETTYCDDIHADRGREGDGLVQRTEEILEAGGRVLIPAFGLGRAQEIALLLGNRLPEIDVLIDGLARDISELYSRNGAPEVLTGRVRKVEHRKREINGFHEGVVITTSGMLTGGAAIPWAQAVLLEPDSALFLCGHQDEEAPGHELEELANADPERPRKVRLRDDQGMPVTIDVAASIHKYNMSAHADRKGLKRIVDEIRPKAVMLVHGEPGPQAMFRDRLNVAGYAVVDNRETWDANAIVVDDRLARRRHGAGLRGRGGRRRSRS